MRARHHASRRSSYFAGDSVQSAPPQGIPAAEKQDSQGRVRLAAAARAPCAQRTLTDA